MRRRRAREEKRLPGPRNLLPAIRMSIVARPSLARRAGIYSNY